MPRRALLYRFVRHRSRLRRAADDRLARRRKRRIEAWAPGTLQAARDRWRRALRAEARRRLSMALRPPTFGRRAVPAPPQQATPPRPVVPQAQAVAEGRITRPVPERDRPLRQGNLFPVTPPAQLHSAPPPVVPAPQGLADSAVGSAYRVYDQYI